MIEHDEVRVVQRVDGGGGRGRGPIVVWAFVAVLVAVVAFGIAGRQEPVQPGDGQAAAGSASPPASSTKSPRPPRSPRVTPSPTPRPFLPEMPNMTLVDAPGVVISRRLGNDLELRTWRPGMTGFETSAVLEHVLADMADSWVDVSPNGRHAAVIQQEGRPDNSVRSRVRIAGPALPTWETEVLPYPLTVTWSADSSMVVIGGAPVWTVVRISSDGAPLPVSVRVAPDPVASPSASPDPNADPWLPKFPVPFAFSVDGKALYGVTVDPADYTHHPAIRVDLGPAEPAVTPVDRYPAGGPGGLAPTGYPADSVDPDTGRTAEIVWGGRYGQLVVRDPDGQRVIESRGLDGWANVSWVGGGQLFMVQATPLDRSGEAVSVQAGLVEADGSIDPVLFAAERVNGAWPMGSRRGFVVLSIQAAEDTLLAVLRTADGATASVRLRQDDHSNVVAMDVTDPASDP